MQMVKVANAKKSKAQPKAVVAKKPYNKYLDVLKGFTILLVVLGHAVQTFAANGAFDENPLFRVIYSFHMPLFMFLSGAAAAYSLRPMNREFLRRKFYQLVIPFMAWYLVGFIINGAYHFESFALYLRKGIVSPDYGLWFLWVLFLNFCCLAAIKYASKYVGLYGYPLVWLLVYALPTGKFGIGLLKLHLPFFVVGYLIFLYREQLARYQTAALFLCVISFPTLAATWHRLHPPAIVAGLSGHLAAHGLSVITIGDLATINVYSWVLLFYKYLVPFSGIGFVYWLLQLWPHRYVYAFFGFLGIYTLDIYATQLYFFRYAQGSSWVAITTATIAGVIMPLLLGAFILRRVPVLSILFLGGRSSQAPIKIAPKA